MTNLTHLGVSELSISNLHGRPLRVAVVMSEEYSYDTAIVENPDGTVSFQPSFAIDLLRALELTMNFTTIPVITKFWGHLLPNKTWVGMISLLLQNKVDLGLSSIADRPFRRAVVDFNIPTNEIRLAAFFQRPSIISSHYSALMKPFQPICWIAVLSLLLGMAISAIILNNVLGKSRMQQCISQKDPTTEIMNKDWVMWSFTAISLRGFYKTPVENSLRITMVAGSLTGVVLYAAYAGTLVSFLSVVIEPIKNMGQLLATTFTFVIVDYELPLKFLSESPNDLDVMLFKRRFTDKSYASMKEAYEEINKGSFVFVTDHAGAYESLTSDFTTLEACRIREVEIENARQKQGTLVPKKSPYKRIIDYQILKTLQFGLVKRWSAQFLKRLPICDDAREYEGVAFVSSSLAFIILLTFGWIVGCLGLLLEVWTYRRINHLGKPYCVKTKGFVL